VGQRLGFRFCTHCGAPLPADAVLCILCGQQREPSARDIIEALTQRGYTLQPQDDPYSWCRNCSAPMLQRSTDGFSHRVCPECGFSDGVLTCTLRALECTPAAGAGLKLPGTDCQLLVQHPSGVKEQFACRVMPGEQVRLHPGGQVALYFTCGKLDAIEDLSSNITNHIMTDSLP
jgi:hypothetical protein